MTSAAAGSRRFRLSRLGRSWSSVGVPSPMKLASGFHPEARAEFYGAIDWYDKRAEGVGSRFETAGLNAIDTALMWPDSGCAWPDWTAEPVLRTTGVVGFPYQVVPRATARH